MSPQYDERHRGRKTAMNWFVSEPVSADSMLQASLSFVEVFCALVGIIAVMMLLMALLHTILAVRSSHSHPESNQSGEAKQRVADVHLVLGLGLLGADSQPDAWAEGGIPPPVATRTPGRYLS